MFVRCNRIHLKPYVCFQVKLFCTQEFCKVINVIEIILGVNVNNLLKITKRREENNNVIIFKTN